MKSILIVFLSFCILGCSNDFKTKKEIKDTIAVVKTPIKPIEKKYYFTIFVLVQPSIESVQQEYGQSYSYKYDFHTSLSTVYEAIEWNEDIKYKKLDLTENEILREFELYDADIRLRARIYNMTPPEKGSTIISRKLYLFDNYKEASIARRKILDDPATYIIKVAPSDHD